MRGAALHFAKRLTSPESYDGFIVTDLMSLADLKALLGPACPPCLAYFHENQFAYPLSPGETMDFQFGFTNLTSALVAERVLFNSQTHFKNFFTHLPRFLDMMPEYRSKWVVEAIQNKSSVLYPGCQFLSEGLRVPLSRPKPPLVIWNHRWEFDKGPNVFFEALNLVLARGFEFRLALLGENFQAVAKAFTSALERFGDRIVQYGYVESKKAYFQWLLKGSVVVSTAQQENFGISMIEGARFGCFPLAPDRLVYPEIIPKTFHADCLYTDREDLVKRLCGILGNLSANEQKRKTLSEAMGCYAWEKRIVGYDEELEKMVVASYK